MKGYAVDNMHRRGVWMALQWTVRAGRRNKRCDSGQYMLEEECSGMKVGSICRRGLQVGSMHRRGMQRV